MITTRVLAKSGSLVNELQSTQGDRIGPGHWPAGAASAPMPTSVRDNPVYPQKFPQLLPSHEEFLTSETEIASLGLWNSVCCNVVTKSVLVTEIRRGDPLSILYRIPLPQDQKFPTSLSGSGSPSPPQNLFNVEVFRLVWVLKFHFPWKLLH